jgi:hypothetical protein
MDQEYRNYVESGNLAAAQRMVDDEASRHGFSHEVFRSNETLVHVFDTVSRSAWFTENHEDALDYGDGPVSRYFLKSDNFASLDNPTIRHRLSDLVRPEDFDDLCGVTYAMAAIREQLLPEFLGVRTESYGMGEKIDHFNPFHPHLIRSAEAVVYDDRGELVPLSHRFPPGSSDIRGLTPSVLFTPEPLPNPSLAPSRRSLARSK